MVNGEAEDDIVELPRRVAGELVLAAVLAFVAGTDVSVPYSSKVFATDDSMKKGAVLSREVEPSWLAGDKKGSYTKLNNPFAAALRGLGLENDLLQEDEVLGAELEASRVPAICGRSGFVSKAAPAMGLAVMPPIELSDSARFGAEEYHAGAPLYDMKLQAAAWFLPYLSENTA